jgi:uncharacterized protein YhbP (UPF0306 family)
MELKELIKNYLKSAKLMQLATVSGEKPWVCTVNYCFDRELNFYWMSLRKTRHSSELSQNPKVSIAVVVDPNKKIGIQAEGEAFEVKGEELVEGHKLYCERYGDKPQRLKEAESNDPNVRSYYKFIPNKVMVFDETNEGLESQELNLN